MARRRSQEKPKTTKSPNRVPPNILLANRASNQPCDDNPTRVEGLTNLKSLLIDDISQSEPGTSSDRPLSETAALHDELNSFRQKWKCELNTKSSAVSSSGDGGTSSESNVTEAKENTAKSQILSKKELYAVVTDQNRDPRDIYSLAKRLFLAGVELEQDEAHHEAIRYYKQAMHLCPDIEHQIFKEQCEASLKSSGTGSQATTGDAPGSDVKSPEAEEEIKGPLYDRILSALHESSDPDHFRYCRPANKRKVSGKHISELPQEMLLLISRYVIGQELDLASLESFGLVCRGLFILTRDPSIWRSVCHRTWGSAILASRGRGQDKSPLDWRQLYLDNPRVNCDGVYISRTRYVRQGDISFQDMAYRPFHVVRYYRYLRFFPDKRVLILTTSEEPERIIPIFRHALHAKQISELSILEGTYEFTESNQLVIEAEKDFSRERNNLQNQQQHQTHHQRRQAIFHWSRQTPLSQTSNMRFELKTVDSRPYRNNVLRWLEYTITTVLETGQEITTYDLNQDTFPSLAFSRVKRFNLRLTEPLPSH